LGAFPFVDAHLGDYFCRVIEDCVAGSRIEAHDASLEAMEYLQVGAACGLNEVKIALESIRKTA